MPTNSDRGYKLKALPVHFDKKVCLQSVILSGVKQQMAEGYQNQYLTLMYFYQEPSGLVLHWLWYKNSSDLVDRPTCGASPEPSSPALDLAPGGLPTPTTHQWYQELSTCAIHGKIIHTKKQSWKDLLIKQTFHDQPYVYTELFVNLICLNCQHAKIFPPGRVLWEWILKS